MTILEVINRSAEFLKKKGVATPRLQVELLLAHALKMPRMNLYLNFEKPLVDKELELLREMVRRRGQREPLQYIVGSVSFCGLEITVNSNVLIPRPETEMLAERAWTYLAQLPKDHPALALDLCTGSGCLAIAMAAKAPPIEVDATDLSEAALNVARENAARHQLSERLHFFQGDFLSALTESRRYDLIVSNPPYIPAKEIETLEPEVRDHEPRMALDGGGNGLDFYRRLATEAGAHLKPGGKIMLELNDHGGQDVAKIFTEKAWTVDAIELDYNKHERIFVAHKAAE